MAKDIFEDVRIRGEADLYLEDNLIQNGKQVTGRPYKVFTASLTQVGVEAPVLTVLENTLGEVTASITSAGIFDVESSGLFTIGKTYLSVSNYYYFDEGLHYVMYPQFISDSIIRITSAEQLTLAPMADGSLVEPIYIEIKVYL